jgi:hypothetical protein
MLVMNKLFLLIILSVFALAPNAQEPEQPAQTDEKKQSANDKKMIREANISLQTTVTGNQEQPRVMYILPWQSPLSPDLEMEMLNSQEDAVFGHVERDEMQRSLEAAGEFDSAED